MHEFTLFVIDIHQNMPISLILTPFDHFQIRLTFAVTPNLILEPCLKGVCRATCAKKPFQRESAGFCQGIVLLC